MGSSASRCGRNSIRSARSGRGIDGALRRVSRSQGARVFYPFPGQPKNVKKRAGASVSRPHTRGEHKMDKALAEFIGTFALVFIGCGAAVIGGMGGGTPATAIDLLGIASAFGFTIVPMAYGIRPVSGLQ